MNQLSDGIGPAERDTNWYFVFISIIFGVFVAVWLEPVTTLFPLLEEFSNPTEGGLVAAQMTLSGEFDTFRERLLSEKILVGVIMFVILVCLWWWYGTFLGHVSPAKGFWLYFYDFVTLCSFAIAFRLWSHPIIFPMIVVIAAFLMLLRFGGVLIFVPVARSASRPRMALIVAIIVLSAYVLVGIGLVGAPYQDANDWSDYMTKLIGSWPFYQVVVIWLLCFGIFSTLLAVLITEGWPFGSQRRPEDWLTDPKKPSRADGSPAGGAAE